MGIAIGLVLRVPAPLKSIADQAIGSASSVPANLAEGNGRSGRDRAHFCRIAYASAKEVDSHAVIRRRTTDQWLDLILQTPRRERMHHAASRPQSRAFVRAVR